MTKQLARVGDKFIVLWERNDRTEYVVCSHYDPSYEEGEQWCWGHYFGDDLLAAVSYFKGETDESHKAQAERWREIAHDIMYHYENSEEPEYVIGNLGLSYEEWEEFGYDKETVDRYTQRYEEENK